MRQARILVVDDEPGMIRVIERILGRRHEVHGTTSPERAVSIAAELRPDLAILDVRMPGMDGFELMGRLRTACADLDVILMTGSATEPDFKLIRAIRERAFYFIQKPFDREVLETLVARWLEIRRLSDDNRRHTQRLERQLAEARAFQQGLLPEPEAVVEGVRVSARYVPCDDLGGDYFDYAPAGEGRAALIIADVSGHGVSAAMLTGVVRSSFHACRTEGYDPLAVSRKIAEGMAAFPAHRFVSLICVLLDTIRRRLEYVNAGHPYGLLWRAGGEGTGGPPRGGVKDGRITGNSGGPDAGGRLVEMVSTGMLISPALVRQHWEKATFPFGAGDRFLLYTDGIPEARSEDSDFGEERILAEIGRTPAGGPPLLEGILGAVRAHCGGRPQADDLTLLTAQLV